MKIAFRVRILIAVIIIALSLLSFEAAYFFTIKYYENDEPYWEEDDDYTKRTQPIKVDDDIVETSTSPLFLLLEKDGYIIIEYFQGGTVYDETNIPVSDLPKTLQEKIINGIPIKNFDELYNFLENYSS